MPQPEFTREELSRIEANAEATRDAGLLKQFNEFEKRLNGRGSQTRWVLMWISLSGSHANLTRNWSLNRVTIQHRLSGTHRLLSEAGHNLPAASMIDQLLHDIARRVRGDSKAIADEAAG